MPEPIVVPEEVLAAQAQREEAIRLEAQREQERLAEAARQEKLEAERVEAARLEAEQRADRLKAEQLEAERQQRLLQEEQRIAEQRREALRREEQALERERVAAQIEAERLALEQQMLADQAVAVAAENATRLANERDLYVTLIRQKVSRNWIRPATTQENYECTVEVTQLPGGEVVNVVMKDCNADAAFERSVENAIYKASPLPDPPQAELFERRLEIYFSPTGSGL